MRRQLALVISIGLVGCGSKKSGPPVTGDGGAAPPHPEVPTGVALPVEEPSTAPAEPAPDAGVPPSLPRGGVLL